MAFVAVPMQTRLLRRRVIDAKGCWLWTGDASRFGHGRIEVNGRKTGVHRVSYAIHVGPIPSGVLVLHKCDVPACFNPDHLFLGSHRDNMQDKHRKGRGNMPSGEKHFRAKITSQDAVSIRQLHANGEGTTALAKQFGLSPKAIRLIVQRINWANC